MHSDCIRFGRSVNWKMLQAERREESEVAVFHS